MFLYLLIALLLSAGIHIALLKKRTIQRAGEIVLLYVLVGYCGVPQVALSIWSLASPDRVAAALGFPAGNPFQAFLGVASLGMGILSLLALWYRGGFRVAPAVSWAVFFTGATFIHLADRGHGHARTHADVLHILATHQLIAILLVAGLLASGLWKRRE